jgi:DNA-binding response OmpR family regulator
LLRIETLLKREYGKSDKIEIDENHYFDLATDTLFVNDEPANLNQKELTLLKLFLKHPNERISHEKIYETLWGFDEEPSDAALRTYIKNLRKILGKERIESIKRYGYKFVK